jgi:hypothetical protein
VGCDAGLTDDRLFTMPAVMAIVTALPAAPLLDAAAPRRVLSAGA